VSRERPEGAPRVDLHTHSYFSDGEHSPRRVAELAREAGLAACALTDHDCLEGIVEFTEAADGFEPVGGVEISARQDGCDVHVLGYFLDPHAGGLTEHLASLAQTRRERTAAMLGRLGTLGIELDPEELAREAGPGTIGRPHIAHALVARGKARSVADAFRRYLRPGTPGYVPKAGPSPAEAIEWIHEAAGVAVLAHPGLLKRRRWIREMADAGLDGLESWHPKHGKDQVRNFLTLARELDLVPTGGSDYHGGRVGDARVGQEPVPEETMDRLRARRPGS